MNIRRFHRDDAEAVAGLWQYWFVDKTLLPSERLVSLTERIFVHDPSKHQEVGSLVAEDESGNLLGFLGASVIPAELDGKPATLAGVFPSVVAPDAPGAVASLLLRKFLAGPQALTFSDGGHVKFERIWELLGGKIAHMQSLRWVKVFRPAQIAADRIASRLRLQSLKPTLRVLAAAPDWVARSVAPQTLKLGSSERLKKGVGQTPAAVTAPLLSVPLTPESLVEISSALHEDARLRPIYKTDRVAWQFREMREIVSQGEFTANLVLTGSGAAIGWYAYYLKRGGISRVYAVETTDRHLPRVIDHLFSDADRRGAGALLGRMEPRLRRPLATRGAFVYNGGSLQMVHSQDRSLIDDALLGRLAFNRLQGENWYWWAIDAEANS